MIHDKTVPKPKSKPHPQSAWTRCTGLRKSLTSWEIHYPGWLRCIAERRNRRTSWCTCIERSGRRPPPSAARPSSPPHPHSGVQFNRHLFRPRMCPRACPKSSLEVWDMSIVLVSHNWSNPKSCPRFPLIKDVYWNAPGRPGVGPGTFQ